MKAAAAAALSKIYKCGADDISGGALYSIHKEGHERSLFGSIRVNMYVRCIDLGGKRAAGIAIALISAM